MLKRFAEGVFAVVLVLGAFLVILYLLGLLLPSGTGLRSLMREDGGNTQAAAGHGSDASSTGWEPVVATLERVQRYVKDKPAETIAWRDSTAGIPLRERHAIHTFDRSEATIRFDRKTRLQLGENSLVILKGLARQRDASMTKASLIMLEGQIEASLQGGGLELNVAGPGGDAQILSAGGSRVRLTVNADRSTTFSVLGGNAEISAGQRRIMIGPGRWVTLDAHGALGRTGALTPAPRPLAPAETAVIPFRSRPPQVAFSWQGRPDDTLYLVDISRDPAFHDLVVSRGLETPEFVHGNLRAGTYYWRVAGSQGRALGLASKPRRLELSPDASPPELAVVFPEGPVAGASVQVTGTVEPGARVFIGAEEVPVGPDGVFGHRVPLDRGANVLVVEAIDAAGNSSYRSRLINAKY